MLGEKCCYDISEPGAVDITRKCCSDNQGVIVPQDDLTEEHVEKVSSEHPSQLIFNVQIFLSVGWISVLGVRS